MGQALYRKYRSRNFSEVVGQDPIISTLQNALKTGKVSHAYLFTGPRGVGKTSVARILAHSISGLDYEQESTHIDIIEIDAASNRRIDEIRDLREKARILPVTAKFKVYIIDEVHMLTREAFNALLKTLEEPPAHVVFILATTEAHKLPLTIISRTQRYTFKPISAEVICQHLALIAKREKIHIDKQALELIARHADGSFRDAISLLDQVRTLPSPISTTQVQSLLGITPQTVVDNVLKAINEGDIIALTRTLQELSDQSYNSVNFANQIAERLRQQLLEETSREKQQQLLHLLRQLLDIPSHPQPQHYLELLLLDETLTHAPINKPSQPVKAKPPKADVKKKISETPVTPQKMKLDEDLWQSVLQTIKEQHNTLYGILRMGEANFDGTLLQISFEFPFHQRRITEAKNMQIILHTIHELSGETVEVECIVQKASHPQPKKTTKPKEENTALQTISNIFGDAEVVDS